ncbi:MAG: efflux RND transporter periplasmic adaptor subunit [Burkholderiales bacterium]|nr:efflux RND transporter periplasmic adaptor subunit [Burkholderiales bacterium]
MSNGIRQCRAKALLYLSPTLAITLLAGCKSDVQATAPLPPTVSVAQPLAKTVTDWDEYTGRLEAVQAVEVRARVSGYLESVHFKDGAIVNKGDLLFVIDPRPYQAIANQAKAEVTRNKVRLDLARNNVERAERLFKSRAISAEELDARTQEQRQGLASLEAAKAAVDAAELNVEFTRVRSPIKGRVSRELVTTGNLVSGGSEGATLLTTIVSLDPIYVYFTADERAYLRYSRLARDGSRPSSRDAENPVKLQLADEKDFSHEGRMDFVDNRIDRATGTMQGRALFPNPDMLLIAGLFAKVKLLGEGPYPALLIPDEAIGTDQSQKFVFIIDEQNVARRKTILPGRLEDGLRIVREGLKGDERVVVDGLQRVRPGLTVTPQAAQAKEKADESATVNSSR